MNFSEPLVFHPIYASRVWGGRQLHDRLGRNLPADSLIGESWEVVDRHDAQSIVADGNAAGLSLHELWTKFRSDVFGHPAPSPRFPLLAKILDARETLSVQVHPPAGIASDLNGEPKTEMWFLLHADPAAALYAGFHKGVTRAMFESAIHKGNVDGLLHKIPVRTGDVMFIPSGRCHAIAAGCLIIEIQQNSDTTYRVFDWNRTGLDGKPRTLHVTESLRSIQFDDYEPRLQPSNTSTIVQCDHFKVERLAVSHRASDPGPDFAIFTVVSGHVQCGSKSFRVGDFFLKPAAACNLSIRSDDSGAVVLKTTLGPVP